MPKLEEHTVVEDGDVMGYVRTNMVGSKVYFPICPVEEWEEMSEEEAEEAAKDVMFDHICWGY